MKNFRSKGGPIPIRTYYPLHEIEEICISELQKLELLPLEPEPIRIDRFIEKRFNTSPQYEQLPDGLLGFTKFGSKGVESIFISQSLDEEGSQVSERRLRTTLAHEAGHGLLHAYLFALGKQMRSIFGEEHDNTPRVLCRNIYGAEKASREYNGQWWEYQANMMMGSLLLPKALIYKAITPYLKTQGLLGGMVLDSAKKELAVKSLANIFNVNPMVVKIRLDQLFPLTDSPQLSL